MFLIHEKHQKQSDFAVQDMHLLLIVLLILEIVALIVAQLIGYFMANYFMKPLEKLYQGMQEMANDPTNDFEPIEIQSGDEIEELAHVYNDMMLKMKAYLEQQNRFVSDAKVCRFVEYNNL